MKIWRSSMPTTWNSTTRATSIGISGSTDFSLWLVCGLALQPLQLLAHFRRIFRLWSQLQIFLIGFTSRFEILHFFLCVAQPQPRVCIAVVILRGFAEAPRGRPEIALLEVEFADGGLFFRLQRIEGVFPRLYCGFILVRRELYIPLLRHRHGRKNEPNPPT